MEPAKQGVGGAVDFGIFQNVLQTPQQDASAGGGRSPKGLGFKMKVQEPFNILRGAHESGVFTAPAQALKAARDLVKKGGIGPALPELFELSVGIAVQNVGGEIRFFSSGSGHAERMAVERQETGASMLVLCAQATVLAPKIAMHAHGRVIIGGAKGSGAVRQNFG